VPAWDRVRTLVVDVDGVLTDGTVWLSADGTEAKRWSVRDGYGLVRLRRAGVAVLALTARESAATHRRMSDLGVPLHVAEDKAAALRQLGLARSDVAYIGDDTVDLGAMALVGLPIAVADAEPEVRAVAAYVTTRPGCAHAVREVCELILAARPAGAG
jgi:YrbI family 3-deoxy-D-manno-octulosonate 8-phosphate phosphatase